MHFQLERKRAGENNWRALVFQLQFGFGDAHGTVDGVAGDDVAF